MKSKYKIIYCVVFLTHCFGCVKCIINHVYCTKYKFICTESTGLKVKASHILFACLSINRLHWEMRCHWNSINSLIIFLFSAVIYLFYLFI